MRKYFLFSLIFFFVTNSSVFAQIPSFEITPHPEPDIENVYVQKTDSVIIITARVTDISGIYLVVTIIRNSQGSEVEREILYDDGAHYDVNINDNIYGAFFSTTGYSSNVYTMDIFAIDNLGYRKDLENVGSFEIIIDNPPICNITVPPTVDINETFNIDVSGSSDDFGITEVRFSSDDSQDGVLTGLWRNWLNWNASYGDWNSVTKTKEWFFDSLGLKEVWVEVKDITEQTSSCYAPITVEKECQTYLGYTICISVSTKGDATKIDPFTVPASVTAGSQVSLSATLKYENGTPIANETISFRDETDNINIGSAITNSSGVAQINYLIALGATIGNHTLKASYQGNSQKQILPSLKTATMNVTSFGNCSKSNNYTICVEISSKGDATKIDPFTVPSSAKASTTVTLSATLKYENGTAIANETISFRDETDNIAIGSAITNTSGVAQINYSIAPGATIGNHTLKASYQGNPQKATLPSEKTATINITKISTQIDPFTVPVSATAGSSVTLSATLKYENGTPIANETISFRDETDNIAIGSAITNTSGVAQISYKVSLGATVGNHTLKASYQGNAQKALLPSEKTATMNVTSFGNCNKSNNYTICVEISTKGEVTKIDPFTIPASATAGSSVILSATLKYENGTPIANETISFRDETDNIAIGSAITNTSGVAQINYSIALGATIGNHTLKASYQGNSQKQILPSEKTATMNVTSFGNCSKNNNYTVCVEVVTKGDTTKIDPFTIPASATAGSSVILSATLKYENGTPIANETISFRDETDNIAIGSAITNTSGVAQINYLIALGATIGNHTLKASYQGNSQKQILPSEKTATMNVTSFGNCSKNNNYTVCVEISTSPQ